MEIKIDNGFIFTDSGRQVQYTGLILRGDSGEISIRKYRKSVVLITKRIGASKGILVKYPTELFDVVREVDMILKRFGYPELNIVETLNLKMAWNGYVPNPSRRF